MFTDGLAGGPGVAYAVFIAGPFEDSLSAQALLKEGFLSRLTG